MAGSLKLDDASDLLLGSMSDLLTTRLLEGDGSYLVGYPLKSLNAYVLARTWAAHEMPRPGSVWTHSLVLDYQSLAQVDDPSSLMQILRRPSLEQLASFSDPILVDATPPLGTEALSVASAREGLQVLYSDHPDRWAVLPPGSSHENEQISLALWRQMWPALRRDTAFFTFSDETMPSIDASCIICFTSPKRADKIRTSERGLEIDALVEDLPNRSPTPLRAFLGRHAFDSPVARSAVRPLVRLWMAMSNDGQETTLKALSEALPSANPSRLVKTVLEHLVSASGSGAPLLKIVAQFGDLEFTARPDGLYPPIQWKNSEDLGPVLDVSGRFTIGSLGRLIFDQVATSAPIGTLAIANYSDRTGELLLRVRPELLDEQAFWDREVKSHTTLIRRAAQLGRPFETVLPMVRGTLATESLQALLEHWPERIVDLVRDLADCPKLERLIGAALGQSPALLDRLIDSGEAKDNLLDEAIAHAFATQGISFPPQSVWKRLGQSYGTPLLPNLAILSLSSAIGDRDADGRRKIIELLPALRAIDFSRSVTRQAINYLNDAFHATWIYQPSIERALDELTAVVFTEGRRVSTDVVNAVSQENFDGVLEAVYRRHGLDTLKGLKEQMIRNSNTIDHNKIRKIDEVIQRHNSFWFW